MSSLYQITLTDGSAKFAVGSFDTIDGIVFRMFGTMRNVAHIGYIRAASDSEIAATSPITFRITLGSDFNCEPTVAKTDASESDRLVAISAFRATYGHLPEFAESVMESGNYSATAGHGRYRISIANRKASL